MTEPTTEAGRRLLEGDFIEADYDGCNIDTRALMAGILAIEREAAARAAGIDAALRIEYHTGWTHGWEDGHRAAGIDVEDIRSLANQHESECTYYDGGDFTCSCGYDEALERVSAWLDEQDRLAAEKEK